MLKAFDQCVDAGARVVSMSLGGSGWSQQAQNLYQTAYEDLGILIVAAGKDEGLLDVVSLYILSSLLPRHRIFHRYLCSK